MPKIPFRTGRIDCVPDQENLDKGRGYIASSKKHEVHPNPFMNGKELTEFLKVCMQLCAMPIKLNLMIVHFQTCIKECV